MTDIKELQNGYESLYECMMQYVWDYNTVSHLVDLQLSIFKAFPDVLEIKSNFSKLFRDITPEFEQDKDLEEAANSFQSLIDETEDTFTDIMILEEIDYDNKDD